MQFYKLSDGSFPNIYEIRQQNPGVGIPDEPEDLTEFGYGRLVLTEKPVAPPGQHAIEDGVDLINGTYHTKWALVGWSGAELQTARDAKWEEIKAERDRRKDGGILVSGNWFHSDTGSRIQWLGLDRQAEKVLNSGGNTATVLQKLGQNVLWKPMGTGARVPVTVQLAFDVVTGVGDLDAVLFYVAEQHKTAMLASPDPHLYDFSAGWPAQFTG